LAQIVETLKEQQASAALKDKETYLKIYNLLMSAHKMLEEQQGTDEQFAKVDGLLDKLSDPNVDKAALLAEAEALFNQLQSSKPVPTDTEAKTETEASPTEENKEEKPSEAPKETVEESSSPATPKVEEANAAVPSEKEAESQVTPAENKQ